MQAFAMEPQVTLQIPGGARRLDRIFALIRSCEYSMPEIYRVQVDAAKPRTPRFNLPFELGIAEAWEMMGSGRQTIGDPYRIASG
jgi:hypothetical protein